ncbi:435_t:CDS:2, partial [Entrophospora sp. SA101]
ERNKVIGESQWSVIYDEIDIGSPKYDVEYLSSYLACNNMKEKGRMLFGLDESTVKLSQKKIEQENQKKGKTKIIKDLFIQQSRQERMNQQQKEKEIIILDSDDDDYAPVKKFQKGRSRPSIAQLYNWKYTNLGNLSVVTDQKEYQLANAGLIYDYQLINVENYQNKGETEPVPYFYQNLGEAEYIVAVYQYMRLLGYPANKITILTTYNGQKALIRDVLNQRCSWNPLFGKPAKVTTVDKYQGQQNDYILLSLVRTKSVGHIRDVRRLIVAFSRARLGLYVFCRKKLFENCYELTPTLNKLLERPDTLQIKVNEMFPSDRDPLNPLTGSSD